METMHLGACIDRPRTTPKLITSSVTYDSTAGIRH